MPNKMTDNEIVKALECCGNDECSKCPLQDGVCSEKDVIKDSLDLINRQKAEIERLKEMNEYKMFSSKEEYQKYLIKKVKAEAVKEFAERLKEKCASCDCFFDGLDHREMRNRFVEDIYNLLKEMVGENDAD